MEYLAQFEDGRLCFEEGNDDKAVDLAISWEFYKGNLLELHNTENCECLINWR